MPSTARTVTTPAPTDTAVPALVWEHMAEALAVEEAAAVTVAGPLRDELSGLLKAFGLRWVREFGPLGDRTQQTGSAFVALMADLGNALSRIGVGDAAARLREVASEARLLGRRQGYVEAGVKAAAAEVSALDLDAIGQSVDVTAEAEALLAKSSVLPTTYQRGSFATVTRTVSVAQQAVNRLDGAARAVTNEQINRGIAAVATALDGRLLWIAERDACATCLALSGHFPDDDGLFDKDATFGNPIRWVPPGGLKTPPRHKWCRCRTTVWLGEVTDATPPIPQQRGTRPEFAHVDMPTALRREAERSVLNGWALPSEPASVRAKAAARLLHRIVDGRAPSGWQVPKRVRSDAERDLKRGTFRTRRFPA